MMTIRFKRKKKQEPRLNQTAPIPCDTGWPDTQPAAQESLRSKLIDRKFFLRSELEDVEHALQILNMVPAAEDFARITRRIL